MPLHPQQVVEPIYEPITLQLVERRQITRGQLLLYFIPDREAEPLALDTLPSSKSDTQADRIVSRR